MPEGLILCQDKENAYFNTFRPRQNGHHFADDVFKCLYLNGNVWFLLKISLKFVPKGPINNILSLVQIMAWHRPGDKSLSEPMMVSLLTHICIARQQWGIPIWLWVCFRYISAPIVPMSCQSTHLVISTKRYTNTSFLWTRIWQLCLRIQQIFRKGAKFMGLY